MWRSAIAAKLQRKLSNDYSGARVLICSLYVSGLLQICYSVSLVTSYQSTQRSSENLQLLREQVQLTWVYLQKMSAVSKSGRSNKSENSKNGSGRSSGGGDD